MTLMPCYIFSVDLPEGYGLWHKLMTKDALSDLEMRGNFCMSSMGGYM